MGLFDRLFSNKQEPLSPQTRQGETAKADFEKERQQAYNSRLIKICSEAARYFEYIPWNIVKAEEELDKAEQNFADCAFSPFWSSIEQAMKHISSVDECAREIAKQSESYSVLMKIYKDIPLAFPIDLNSVQKIDVGHAPFDRMSTLVRKAQCNFEFASIYEQRKTNQLLVSGFTSLAQALDGMGQRIAESVDGLSHQISEMSLTLNESINQFREESQQSSQRASECVEEFHSAYQKELSDQAERHERALEMLDNIQRRRMPTGFYAGIGTKPAP